MSKQDKKIEWLDFSPIESLRKDISNEEIECDMLDAILNIRVSSGLTMGAWK